MQSHQSCLKGNRQRDEHDKTTPKLLCRIVLPKCYHLAWSHIHLNNGAADRRGEVAEFQVLGFAPHHGQPNATPCATAKSVPASSRGSCCTRQEFRGQL